MANIIDKQKSIITILKADSRIIGFSVYDNLITEFRSNAIVIEPDGNNYLDVNTGTMVLSYNFVVYIAIKTSRTLLQANRDTIDKIRSYILEDILNVNVTSEVVSEAVSANNEFSLYKFNITTTT